MACTSVYLHSLIKLILPTKLGVDYLLRETLFAVIYFDDLKSGVRKEKEIWRM
jgi:hypothetical protein